MQLVPAPAPAEIGDDDIAAKLTRNKQDAVVGTSASNLALIFTGASDLKGRMRFNDLTKEIEITEGIFANCGVNDLALEVKIWLEIQWQCNANVGFVGEYLLHVARKNSYNPVAEYLDALVWDGAPRLNTWLIDYCKAQVADDGGGDITNYVQHVGSKWLLSAVARAFEPGAKVDTVLILEGRQGNKKSTALKELGGKWFSDAALTLADKDSSMMASRFWIVELAELAALKVGNVEAQKGFISRQSDDFRPPYARCVETTPRRCVFAGTVNPTGRGYLIDETGNRRWWCVSVGMVDTVALRRDRDQIWAEAVQRYKAGEAHWFEPQEQLVADRVVDLRRRKSELVEPILDWWRRLPADGRARFTLAEVAQLAIGIRKADLPRHSKAIGLGLKDAGFDYSGAKVQYKGGRCRVYTPSADLLAENSQ